MPSFTKLRIEGESEKKGKLLFSKVGSMSDIKPFEVSEEDFYDDIAPRLPEEFSAVYSIGDRPTLEVTVDGKKFKEVGSKTNLIRYSIRDTDIVRVILEGIGLVISAGFKDETNNSNTSVSHGTGSMRTGLGRITISELVDSSKSLLLE